MAKSMKKKPDSRRSVGSRETNSKPKRLATAKAMKPAKRKKKKFKSRTGHQVDWIDITSEPVGSGTSTVYYFALVAQATRYYIIQAPDGPTQISIQTLLKAQETQTAVSVTQGSGNRWHFHGGEIAQRSHVCAQSIATA
jgi:hypothetical protein